jgi:hypothetical protein
MEKLEFNIEKVKKHLRGEKIDLEYLCRLFSEGRFNNELDHAIQLEWYDDLKKQDTPEKNLDHILYELNYEKNPRQSHTKSFLKVNKWFSGVVAVLILPLLKFTAYNVFDRGVIKETAWVEINSPAESCVQFTLSDCPKGGLKSGSSLKYNENFINNRKLIEDYFKEESPIDYSIIKGKKKGDAYEPPN